MWSWPKKNKTGVAQYITPRARNFLTLKEGRLEILKRGGIPALVRAIYETLCEADIRYVPEPYNPDEYVQSIRTPTEIFGHPHEGTCLDLATLFCGLCLGNELIPILIIVEGHALVAVSLNYDLKHWNSMMRSERTLFEDLVTNQKDIQDLLDGGSYLGVECTGFAVSHVLPQTSPEGVGRDVNGLLSFERAVQAGNEQLNQNDRPFSFAIDVAVAHHGWSIPPLEEDGGFDANSFIVYREYGNRFARALETEFPDSAFQFNLTYGMDGDVKSADSLIDEMINETRLILRGYAGGGKSSNLKRMASRVLDKNNIPVLINLKNWTLQNSTRLSKVIEEQRSAEDKFDILLRASITDLNRDMLNSFPPNSYKFIMVDGLNEVDGKETRNNILSVLDEYIQQKSPYISVLVADRNAAGDSPPVKWRVADLNLLHPEFVSETITNYFGLDSYENLSEKSRELLRTPYFLDYALESENPNLESAAEAIENFFRISFFQKEEDIIGLDDLAKAAFDAYDKFKSTSFEIEVFQGQIGNDLWTRLLDSGVIRTLEDRAFFDHQLKHDYLASRYLAGDESLWNSAVFDAVTFEAKNLEPLLMTLEQLGNETRGDAFGRKLYDWNWLAAVLFITEAVKQKERLCSGEMIQVMLAVVAEKLFDSIRFTRDRARKQLLAFTSELGGLFWKAENIDSVIKIIGEFNSQADWFLKWRELFSRNSGALQEAEIRLITDEDAILGWTAANVIRRFNVNEGDLRQLRGIYDAHDARHQTLDRYRDAVQWRVVHALGRFDDKENVKLLLRALDGKGYHWAKYGAGRSLIEIAAITGKDELRNEIIQELTKRLNSLQSKVIVEICQAALHREAQGQWENLMKEFLSKALEAAELKDKDKETVDYIFRRFVESKWNE